MGTTAGGAVTMGKAAIGGAGNPSVTPAIEDRYSLGGLRITNVRQTALNTSTPGLTLGLAQCRCC